MYVSKSKSIDFPHFFNDLILVIYLFWVSASWQPRQCLLNVFTSFIIPSHLIPGFILLYIHTTQYAHCEEDRDVQRKKIQVPCLYEYLITIHGTRECLLYYRKRVFLVFIFPFSFDFLFTHFFPGFLQFCAAVV